jgi:DNA primase
MIDFAEIKSRHSLEGELGKRGVELRRAPGGWVARCPIHGGKKGWAFSVNATKQMWYCHSECRRGGDVFSLVMALDGAADAKAAAEILEGRPLTDDERHRPKPARQELARLVEARVLPAVPKLYKGEERHLRQVAELRKLFLPAMDEAQKQGCLRFCVAYDHPAFAVLDVENPCNVQVRRMDGKLWFDDGSAASGKKVMGVKGNWAAWPVGLSAAMRSPKSTILLVEGTGDFLAGWDVRMSGHDVVPVAMFGAGQSIHPSALPLLEGREVVIVEQHDQAGKMAAENWQRQCLEAHARVRVWQVPGEGEDLNDYMSRVQDGAAVMKG